MTMDNLNDLYKEFFDKAVGSGVELTPELKDLQQKIAAMNSEPAPPVSDSKLDAFEAKINQRKEIEYFRFSFSNDFWREYDVYIEKTHLGHKKFLELMTKVMPSSGYGNMFSGSKLDYSVRNMEFWLLAGGRITIHDVQYLIVFRSVRDKYVICKLVELYYAKGGSFSNAGLFCIKRSLETLRIGYFQMEEQIEQKDEPMRFNPTKYKPEWYEPKKPKDIILEAKYLWNYKYTDNGIEYNIHVFQPI